MCVGSCTSICVCVHGWVVAHLCMCGFVCGGGGVGMCLYVGVMITIPYVSPTYSDVSVCVWIKCVPHKNRASY